MKKGIFAVIIVLAAIYGISRNSSSSGDNAPSYRTEKSEDQSNDDNNYNSETAEAGTDEMEAGGEEAEAPAGAALELPSTTTGPQGKVIRHTGFTLSFNLKHNNPNWVAWELERSETTGSLKRTDDFEPDTSLPRAHQVTTNDYRRSGYDRGHQVPAADMKWSPRAMAECFLMSNICPQTHGLNAGPWSKLEAACRRWANREGRVYIACGPIYRGSNQPSIGQRVRVTVPDAFFKVVLCMTKGKEKAIGFVYDNRDGKQDMSQAAMSVDEVEKITGFDFFHNLPDELEDRLEASCKFKYWQ